MKEYVDQTKEILELKSKASQQEDKFDRVRIISEDQAKEIVKLK